MPGRPSLRQIPPLKIDFSAEDRAEILRRIDRCLATGQLAQGENVEEFEAAFARYVGARHAVAVSSGGTALEAAMRGLDVRGREVLVPTNTFVATATAVLLAGGRVRLVDADARTLGVSLATLEAAVTSDSRGVILVHVGGIISPEIERIRAWCAAGGLWLVEDAAHAHGSALAGTMAGQFGCAGAYSFFATKVVTSGEGGMLVTDDADLAARVRGLRDYGKRDPWVSWHVDVASNWRMPELCAAVGVVHLRRLDEFIAWREKVAGRYTELLRGTDVTPVLPVGRSSWYKYAVLLPPGRRRDDVARRMRERGVRLSGGVYDTPLHRQPALAAIAEDRFPVADDICARHVCLPIYYGMTDDDVGVVVVALQAILRDDDRARHVLLAPGAVGR